MVPINECDLAEQPERTVSCIAAVGQLSLLITQEDLEQDPTACRKIWEWDGTSGLLRWVSKSVKWTSVHMVGKINESMYMQCLAGTWEAITVTKLLQGISGSQVSAVRNTTSSQSPKGMINMWLTQGFLTWGKNGDSILGIGRQAYNQDFRRAQNPRVPTDVQMNCFQNNRWLK